MMMKKDRITAITNLVLKIRPLVLKQFVRPIKEIHRGVFPPGYIQVMFLLEKQNAPISMSDLAVVTSISKPNLTTVIDRLCTDGFAERTSDKSDRRVINISITDQGVAFLNTHRQEVLSFIENKLSILEDEDIDKLGRALADMEEVLRKMTQI